MKFEKLQPEMTVYDVDTYTMGNTRMKSVGVWSVRVVSIDADSRSVMASWNSNPAKRFYAHSVKKWREKRPVLVSVGFGYRLQTREEAKAAKSSAVSLHD